MKNQEVIDLWEAYNQIYESAAGGIIGTAPKSPVAKPAVRPAAAGGIIGTAPKSPVAKPAVIGIKQPVKAPPAKVSENQEFEMWVNSLVEDGYDLSDYTWDDMYEMYVNAGENESDLFDYILEHLVAEGYADTNQNALVIMANMSEEWKQSIVEAEVVAAKGGVPGFAKVKPTKEGGFLGIGARTVNKPVPGSFRPSNVSSQDAARYNNELDKKHSGDGRTDSTTASTIQRRARASGHSGYMRVNNPDSIPNTGIPNRPTPQRASDQNRVRG